MKILTVVVISLILFNPIILYLVNKQIIVFDLIITLILACETLIFLNKNIKKKWFYVNEYWTVFPLSWQGNLLYLYATVVSLIVIAYCVRNPIATSGFSGILYRLGLILLINSWVAIKATRKTEKVPWTFKIKIR